MQQVYRQLCYTPTSFGSRLSFLRQRRHTEKGEENTTKRASEICGGDICTFVLDSDPTIIQRENMDEHEEENKLTIPWREPSHENRSVPCEKISSLWSFYTEPPQCQGLSAADSPQMQRPCGRAYYTFEPGACDTETKVSLLIHRLVEGIECPCLFHRSPRNHHRIG